MKFWVGVTDKNWFEYLASINPDEVNFWSPSGRGFQAIDIGAPFLFKLKQPFNKIVGGGYFVRSEKIPLSMAWEAFGNKNGAGNISDLRDSINNYRSKKEYDPTIGCIILNEPFFFTKESWIDVPTSFPMNHPSGITYDMNEGDGKKIMQEVNYRTRGFNSEQVVREPISGYGKEYLRKTRLGHGGFASLIRLVYNKQCAITGEKILPTLQAAHIRPFDKEGPNKIENGLLLRSDFHLLFDGGYLTVTPEYKIEVSRKIKEEFNNGKYYYTFHGKDLNILPKNDEDRPSLDFIRWHNENVYKY